MKKATATMAIAALFICLPALVHAQTDDMQIKGKWSLAVYGGVDAEISGDVHDAGTGTVLGLPTAVQAKSFGDVYKTTPNLQVSLGYGVWKWGEILGIFTYAKTSAEELQVGDVAGLPLFALFDDYQEFGLELGYRHFFIVDSVFKPYASVAGGIKFIDAINARLSVPAAAVVLEDVNFYDSSTVIAFGANAGFRFDLNSNLSLGVEGGIHYQGKPSQLEGLAGTGLENLNDVGDRWTSPVLAHAIIRF
jgi:hypothetical protein